MVLFLLTPQQEPKEESFGNKMPIRNLEDQLRRLQQNMDTLTLNELDTLREQEMAYVQTFRETIDKESYRLADLNAWPSQEFVEEQWRFLGDIAMEMQLKAQEAMTHHLLLLLYVGREQPTVVQKASFWWTAYKETLKRCYKLEKEIVQGL